MDIKEIIKETDIAKKVTLLKKGRLTDLPDIAAFENDWDQSKHKIYNTATRPDKTVYYAERDTKGNPTDNTLSRIEKVARISLAIQKLIVKRAVSFLFGNPVKIVCTDEQSKTLAAIKRILKDSKQDSLNRRIATINSVCTEVAECWFTVDSEPFSTYGFESKLKVKNAVFSPLKGDKLYPFFDETGDMVAFSREYKVKDDGRDVLFFETWTKDVYTKYKQDGSSWKNALDGEQENVKLTIGKIPIVYGQQEEVEWLVAQPLIERLEKLLSNFADTNDYHGSPKIAVQGEVKGFSAKGEAGGILELSEGASASYLAWAQAPESIKLEIESLLRQIYTLTQTPDISFEGVKGLGSAMSGQALRMLFLDAHLKVMEKREIYDSYLERRLNILKAFIATMHKEFKSDADSIELNVEIIPFIIDDNKEVIDDLIASVTGGILSKKTAVGLNPLVEDADEEITLLEEQSKNELSLSNDSNKLDEQQNEE